MVPLGIMDLPQLVTIFKALGEPNRIRIAGLLAEKRRCGQELAAELNLSNGTISHHLKYLKKAGLVKETVEHPYSFYELDAKPLQRAMSAVSGPKKVQQFADDGRIPAERRKVLQAFFDGNRLVSIPARRKKKEIVLEEILRRLPRRRHYEERQLSRWIEAIHPDFCTIRREFIMGHYMTREAGRYTLTERGRAAIGLTGHGWRSQRVEDDRE